MKNRVHEVATFIGADHSCGLRNGTNYDVSLVQLDGEKIYRVHIHGRGISIPYDTMSAVQKNWDFRKE